MTGVAYISSCTRNETRNARSRYLVVIDVTNKPKPSLIMAITASNTGVSNRYALGVTDFLIKRKYSQTQKNNPNCIRNFSRPDTTLDKGSINRGKYTLPNTDALSVNVLDVMFSVSEK